MPTSIEVPQNLDPVRLFFEQYFKIPVSRELNFQRKVAVEFSRGNYLVKTIESTEELRMVLELRYRIFRREFQGKWNPIGTDWELLDGIADHLAIFDKRTGKPVGTYRLLSTAFTNQFYSAGEFKIDSILAEPGIKLELSRAGIDKKHRNGIVLTLLWRGIVEYIKQVDAKYVFGCASVKTMDLGAVIDIQEMFQQKGLALEDSSVAPREDYQRRHGGWVTPRKTPTPIPPLFQSYLKAGARVALSPAWDYEFKCVDFFTVLQTDKLTERYQRKYE